MFKKYGVIITLTGLVLLLLAVFFNRDKMYNYISENMQGQLEETVSAKMAEEINSKYNYAQNNGTFEFTFLEFSSGLCANCKRMEPVMEEIKTSEKVNVNVVYIQTTKPENQDIMKYYGIAHIPMQILLDKNGKEFFRNNGFISTRDLESKFNAYSKHK